MKIGFVVLFLCVVSAALYAMDLPSLARREKARRSALASKSVRSFGDRDLERYRRERSAAPEPPPRVAPPPEPRRDLAKEKLHWRKETIAHERELSRIDANIRRLQWRLKDRQSRRKRGSGLWEDPTVGMLEDSIQNLTQERKELVERFHERARKDGALPGWLR